MRRRLTTLKAKSGGAQNGNGNGNVRQVIDECVYRNHLIFVAFRYTGDRGTQSQRDPTYSGLANGSRPKDYNIFLPRANPLD